MDRLKELTTRARKSLLYGREKGLLQHLDPSGAWPREVLPTLPQLGREGVRQVHEWIAKHGGTLYPDIHPDPAVVAAVKLLRDNGFIVRRRNSKGFTDPVVPVPTHAPLRIRRDDRTGSSTPERP